MKDIFSYNVDIKRNAYMSWRTDESDFIKNIIVLAEGFNNSSLLLAKEILKDNYDKKADSIIFPILFNANHSIELYLKAISWTLNILLKKNKKVECTHDIKNLFHTVHSNVITFENENINYSDEDSKKRITDFEELTMSLKKYLDELYEKFDDNRNNIDFSRYPFDLNYESYFYIKNDAVVDIENLILRFTEIGTNLDMIANYYFYNINDFLKRIQA